MKTNLTGGNHHDKAHTWQRKSPTKHSTKGNERAYVKNKERLQVLCNIAHKNKKVRCIQRHEN